MEAMRKEIARLNKIIAKGWMDGKIQNGGKKVEEPKTPQYKNGRHPSVKHGLGHTKGGITNGRKLVNGFECVQFERKEQIGIVQPTQTAAVSHKTSNTTAPRKNGKAANLTSDQTKPKKKMPQQKQVS
jgi:hypothetical protein